MASPTTDRRYGLNPGAAIKTPVKVASTANIAALAGLLTIDTIVLVAGDRVLVKNQTNSVQNGIYTADAGNWTRDADFDGAYDAQTGTLVEVIDGGANINTFWRVTSTGTITIGTSAITFAEALFSDTATLGFTQAGVGAVQRSAQSKMRDIVNVQDFVTAGAGTVASPFTGWDGVFAANLIAGQGVDTGFNVSGNTEYWFSGVPSTGRAYYSYSTPLVINSPHGTEYRGSRLVGHGDITLQFTGIGKAVSVTADNSGALSSVYNFGMENLRIRGNQNCTDALYVMGVHHSTFRNIRLAECTGAGLRVAFSVCSVYDNIVYSKNEAGFTTNPSAGIVLQADPYSANATTANTFINPIIEGIVGTGISLVAANGNKFIGGTAEGTTGVGVNIAALCERNSFIGIDLESNSGGDIVDSGIETAWINCVGLSSPEAGDGAGVKSMHLTSGKSQTIIGGDYQNVTIDVGNTAASFLGTIYNRLGGAGFFTNNSVTTYYQNVTDYTNAGVKAGVGLVTITDGSGAGLAITSTAGRYWVGDPQNVTVRFNITFPVTADGTGNLLFGLPYGAANLDFFGGYINSSDLVSVQGLTIYVVPNTQNFRIYDGAALLTNAQCSGKSFLGTISYARV